MYSSLISCLACYVLTVLTVSRGEERECMVSSCIVSSRNVVQIVKKKIVLARAHPDMWSQVGERGGN